MHLERKGGLWIVRKFCLVIGHQQPLLGLLLHAMSASDTHLPPVLPSGYVLHYDNVVVELKKMATIFFSIVREYVYYDRTHGPIIGSDYIVYDTQYHRTYGTIIGSDYTIAEYHRTHGTIIGSDYIIHSTIEPTVPS